MRSVVRTLADAAGAAVAGSGIVALAAAARHAWEGADLSQGLWRLPLLETVDLWWSVAVYAIAVALAAALLACALAALARVGRGRTAAGALVAAALLVIALLYRDGIMAAIATMAPRASI